LQFQSNIVGNTLSPALSLKKKEKRKNVRKQWQNNNAALGEPLQSSD
jgi:hypothetical protein